MTVTGIDICPCNAGYDIEIEGAVGEDDDDYIIFVCQSCGAKLGTFGKNLEWISPVSEVDKNPCDVAARDSL